MVLNSQLISAATQEENSYLSYNTNTQKHSPLSLNHLIQEGIYIHILSKRKRAKFELKLFPNLREIAGDPNQLRRVFEQMIDCFVESTAAELPRIMFETKNVDVTDRQLQCASGHEYLSPGTYVYLTVEINDGKERPSSCAEQARSAESIFKPFVWSQICEVLEVHGGTIVEVVDRGLVQTNAVTIIEIALPALDS